METEVEAKFLNIDIEKIRAKLKALGASLIYAEVPVRQKVFDYPDFHLNKADSWLRLRDENNKIVLTFKKWEKEGVDGMKEIETKVESFEETEKILFALGMIVKSNQEKKRELWKLDDVECMIDTWPWIPTFIEAEGESEEKVKNVATKLGFKWEDAQFGGVARIYKQYFDVQYEQIDKCKELVFSPVPEWLEKARVNSHITQ